MIGAEEKSRGSDGSAGFGDGFGIGGEQFQGSLDFVFADGDNGVNEALHVIEVDIADALGAQAVGDGLRNLFGRELDDFAGTQAGLGVGGELRFDTDYLYFWPR